MQGRNVSSFEYIVWMGGREFHVRAMTASEAKLKVARKAIAQGDVPYSPEAAEQLARQATARRARSLRALGA